MEGGDLTNLQYKQRLRSSGASQALFVLQIGEVAAFHALAPACIPSS